MMRTSINMLKNPIEDRSLNFLPIQLSIAIEQRHVSSFSILATKKMKTSIILCKERFQSGLKYVMWHMLGHF